MALQMQDLHRELDQQREELKLFHMAKESTVPDDPLQGTFINTQKLVKRVTELEDLVQELKNQSSPQDVLDLKEIIARQSSELAA